MPHYQLQISKGANRDYNKLPVDVQSRLKDVLDDVSTHRSPQQHPKCDLLHGSNNLYKIRSGDYRAVVTLDKPELRILTVGHRGTVYNDIDELHDIA